MPLILHVRADDRRDRAKERERELLDLLHQILTEELVSLLDLQWVIIFFQWKLS